MSQDLKNIPGIGKNIEQHLFNIGIRNIDDLKGKIRKNSFMKTVNIMANKWINAYYMSIGLRFTMLKMKSVKLKN